MRDCYPLLVEWIEANRRGTGLGAQVVARLAKYHHDRTPGPTWWASGRADRARQRGAVRATTRVLTQE